MRRPPTIFEARYSSLGRKSRRIVVWAVGRDAGESEEEGESEDLTRAVEEFRKPSRVAGETRSKSSDLSLAIFASETTSRFLTVGPVRTTQAAEACRFRPGSFVAGPFVAFL